MWCNDAWIASPKTVSDIIWIQNHSIHDETAILWGLKFKNLHQWKHIARDIINLESNKSRWIIDFFAIRIGNLTLNTILTSIDKLEPK